MTEPALLLHLVDLALLISVAELLWLLARSPAGLPRLAVLANLGAGLALMLALRLSLAGQGLWPVAACLLCAGLAHVLDLTLRQRGAVGAARRVDPPLDRSESPSP